MCVLCGVQVCRCAPDVAEVLQTNSMAFSPQANYRLSECHLLAKFSASFCR
jgi:hypothetical protein